MTAAPRWPYPEVFAHRGGGTLAPENTLAGLDAAARLGQRAIEFDVTLSSDGVPFLLHDDTLDRTTNGRGPAAAQAFAELSQLDAGGWFDAAFAGEPLPTLRAVAERCERLGLAANIEIKPSPGRAAETGRIVGSRARKLWSGRPAPLLSSFSFEALEAARSAAPHFPRGLLFAELPPDWRERAEALGCASLHVDQRRLDATTIERIRGAGLSAFAYTVDDPERARELFAWGVDAVCTDRIDRIVPARSSGGTSPHASVKPAP